MTESSVLSDQITAFEQAYDYDASYLHELLAASPGGFDAFDRARAIAQYREALPAEAFYVAAVTVMQEEDCGSCLRLNLRMAMEAGVDRRLLEQLLNEPQDLPAEFLDVRNHARSVLRNELPDVAAADRIKQWFGEAAFAELGLCIVGSRIFPTLKRALLKAGACYADPFDFERQVAGSG